MSASKGVGAPAIRYRPIYGGIFGKSGEYVMGTMSCIERGLHAVRFMVLHPKTGGVLSVATDKTEALSQARRVLKAAATLSSANDDTFVQSTLWADDELPESTPGAKLKAIPRRRREVFDKSGGRCFYCGTVLKLDGKWHIEHQMPRALMGPDELLNLVAACVPCNLAKSDRTALEFLAEQQQSTHA
ncbi:MAG: HNH endonuclease [Sphingobacteriales bacterium]|nr:MAG: HNH endonuclease [Sphingobacteriales bacterium]